MDEISLSLEETNKLRIAQGLKPIPIPTANSDREHTALPQKAPTPEELIDQFKVNGYTLLDGVAEEDLDDWLSNLGTSKSQPQSFPVEPLPEEAIPKLSINHSAREIGTLSEDAIFTLKDSNILDEGSDGDQLVNADLEAQRKLKEEIKERKKMGKVGNVQYQDDSEDEATEISVLNGETTIKINGEVVEEEAEKRKIAFSLEDEDIVAEALVSDFVPIKMKKAKKKKDSSSRKRKLDEEMQPVKLQKVELSSNASLEDDDDELQAMLALSRKTKQKSRKKMTPEQLAVEVRQISEEEEKEKRRVEKMAARKNGGLVIDATTEFLSGLENITLPEVETTEVAEKRDVVPDIHTEEAIPVSIKQEGDHTEDVPLDVKQENLETRPIHFLTNEAETPTFDGGLSDTLRFLQSRNVITKKSETELSREKQNREWQRKTELMKLQQEIDQRVQQSTKITDKRHAKPNVSDDKKFFRELEDRLKNYNPEVKLKYTDDFGRELNTKEAFKHMSHQFHGTGPGKAKIDKTLKKIEEERKARELASLI
ncbi:hypothetical protein BABINDRAFT_166083 [Babjeviella inositovora NRRL Y-12698]|uniref:SART-1 protein n=1 Tax=Babjeviella inositovora NRRL Y-12698 TaxID=984486 RepID=A0A1E3QUP5_9ASCO|nr:uncharacterized protein BABINDRAFT_166083 [Babjeviella inositovora NRRL Y-12698]ODQ81405.1 hypothetical protein BABINDRAFT_166083 [Babjeviella inositovora NRRL Y-12698]